MSSTAEDARILQDERREKNWKRWGPYLSERQWGTVREDYSEDGSAWEYFSHDQSRMRAYRWGEDGLLGITDRECRLCFAFALWNGKDAILKERLFGLTGSEGNHGEDVKEVYYYLDSTPTHSYMKGLYRYPQREYPYAELVRVNAERGVQDREFELEDTGAFEDGKYWDFQVEYAKANANDITIVATVTNCGPERAMLHVLPQLWFRNTWSWGLEPHDEDYTAPHSKPGITEASASGHTGCTAEHPTLSTKVLLGKALDGAAPSTYFTENDSNHSALFGSGDPAAFTKDGFHRRLVHGDVAATNPAKTGTKAALHYQVWCDPGESKKIELRLFEPNEAAGVDDAGRGGPDGPRSYDNDLGGRRRDSAVGRHPMAGAPSMKLPDLPEAPCSDPTARAEPTSTTVPSDDSDDREWAGDLTVIHQQVSDLRRNLEFESPTAAEAESAAGANPKAAGGLPRKSTAAKRRSKCFRLVGAGSPIGPGVGVQQRISDLGPPAEAATMWAVSAATHAARLAEANAFFDSKQPEIIDPAQRSVLRQAYAGMMWSKQFFYFVVKKWLDGDGAMPKPPSGRVRNQQWRHLHNRDIISMPDKWEYPWYASWDLAFHMVPISAIDLGFAKQQLLLFLREWYMHPNGQMPAYEWAFEDVNPPVHAWSCLEVFKLTKRESADGHGDYDFLARCFHKLLINFAWWINRKDPSGLNLFSGGFLGLDNIGVFDRSAELPTGGSLEQADGTSWMGMFCANMLEISIELATKDPAYEDVCTKFFEHFLQISDAMNNMGGSGLWDDEDGFYYDVLVTPDGASTPLKVRSMVGLIPMYACLIVSSEVLARLPGFKKRTEWLIGHCPEMAAQISLMDSQDSAGDAEGKKGFSRLLALPSLHQLQAILGYLFDEDEFLAPYGIRSLSKYHDEHPFELRVGDVVHRVNYVPGESNTHMFGGNSNWRGPIWFPVNYMIIKSLRRYHAFYGDELQVEVPTRSGNRMNLGEAAKLVASRLAKLFLPDPAHGNSMPCHGGNPLYGKGATGDSKWDEKALFYEFFHPETGRGLGASHQTGWTGLITDVLYIANTDVK